MLHSLWGHRAKAYPAPHRCTDVNFRQQAFFPQKTSKIMKTQFFVDVDGFSK